MSLKSKTFKLLTTVEMWKRVINYGTGDYIDGVWVEDTSQTITYEPIQGRRQPYPRAETNMVLPSGVRSTDTQRLWTEQDLVVDNDLKGTSTIADVIYFEDPTLNPNTHGYVVYEREDWDLQGAFKLINKNFNKYVCIRQEKLENARGEINTEEGYNL